MKLVIATRKSPLALVQAEAAAAHLSASLRVETELHRIVTTGDRQAEWSLQEKGGKGLFTSELEEALRRGEADVAVHSTKDLPGECASGLVVAGYLPRADARDVLVTRADVSEPAALATGSARRRLQVSRLFPKATFTEIRGNVDTRLKKIAEKRQADGTILAAAGLGRLGIAAWPGLVFRHLSFTEMVPAVGQGAVAIQCRSNDAARFAAVLDASTARAVAVERAFQAALGAGCHTAFGAHLHGDELFLFHEEKGFFRKSLAPQDFAAPGNFALSVLDELGLGGR
jgi:hydroxymethylbilane synthase